MATAYLLGTGAAISGAGRTTTMICVCSGSSTLLIDCGGDAVARMQQVGVDVETIRALFLTHEHIDHVGGFPLLYKELWLSDRRHALPVYGLPPALVQAARCFATYDTRAFIDLPPLSWHAVVPDTPEAVYRDDAWEIHAASGRHGVPVIGLRITCLRSGGVLTYTSDTSPTEAITRLARGSDLLLHEATGALPGHSTAVQAAETARAAQVGRLVLVHLPPSLPESDLSAAREIFAPIDVGKELHSYAF